MLFFKDPNSVKIALSCFEEFNRYVGLRLNRTKTEAIILYNNGGIQINQSLNIKWHTESFKTLGIWYSLDCCEMLETKYKRAQKAKKTY